jgi:3-oxoacyl-[acyl-carrier-protein] synthase-3
VPEGGSALALGAPGLRERAPAAPQPPPLLVRGAAVSSVGVAVPSRVVDNAAIAARLGVDEEWIVARTGVRERRIAGPGEELTGLAAQAGRRALETAGLAAAELDLVLVATMSHEQLSPNAAPLVAERLGAAGAGAIDVGAACSGFVSALALAAAQVEAGRAEAVLVVGADLMSRLVDHRDRATAALFGDGAGAVLVTACDRRGTVGPAVLGCDGSRADLVAASRAEAILRMKGHDTFRQAVERLCEATAGACAAAGIGLDEVDVFAYHQANARILAAVGERLELEPERVVDCIERYGNTSAATIPLALFEAQRSGLLTPGSRALLAAFGGGLTWAATVVEWDPGDSGQAVVDGH